MEITLTKDLEGFVERKVREGGFADASEVIQEALQNYRSFQNSADIDSSELAALLLRAVKNDHAPIGESDFEKLRARAKNTTVSR